MTEYNLTEIIYDHPQKGENFKLYIYCYEGGTKHGGALWFTSGIRKYPDEQTDAGTAKLLVEVAMAKGYEVRITNGGDFMVFHALGGKVIYPAPALAETFWDRV